MTWRNQMRMTNQDAKKGRANPQPVMPADATHSSQLPSSPGDSPKEMTPKDITPSDAAWNDLTQRNISSGDPAQREEFLLDEAIEQSFPASDPTAELPASAVPEKMTQPSDEDEMLLDDAIELTFPASDPIAVTPHDKLCVKPRL